MTTVGAWVPLAKRWAALTYRERFGVPGHALRSMPGDVK